MRVCSLSLVVILVHPLRCICVHLLDCAHPKFRCVTFYYLRLFFLVVVVDAAFAEVGNLFLIFLDSVDGVDGDLVV